MSFSTVVKVLASPILFSSAVTPLVLITKNSLAGGGIPNLIKTNISLSELQTDKSCRDFWDDNKENKRLYVCRNKTNTSKPIFWYYEDTVVKTNQPNLERVLGLRYQDTNIHPQLSIKLLNGFQDSSANYPHWMTNWKNSYLEVERDCTLNLSTPSSDTITHFYCKKQDKEEPLQIVLDSNVQPSVAKN